jgi:dihydroorotase-like cyclic amidohydrolase
LTIIYNNYNQTIILDNLISFAKSNLNMFPNNQYDLLLSDIKIWEKLKLFIVDTHFHWRWEEYIEKWISPEESIKETQLWQIWISCFMPNTKPALIDFNSINSYSQKIGNIKSWNYYYFWLRDDNFEDAEIALQQKNIVGFKIYPSLKNSWTITTSFSWEKSEVFDNSSSSNSTIDNAIRLILKYNKCISFHAEDPNFWHSSKAEIQYIKNVIIPLAIRYKEANVIVAHVSTRESAEIIIETNKKYDTNITMELTPHHLYFSEEDIKWNPILKCFPPLRTKKDQIFLQNLLKRIWEPLVNIMFGSDHAPHPKIKKNCVFDEASWWIPNIRDAVCIILTLWAKNQVTIWQIQDFFCKRAIQILDIQSNNNSWVFIRENFTPNYDYYNWNVYNPFKEKELLFKS